MLKYLNTKPVYLIKVVLILGILQGHQATRDHVTREELITVDTPLGAVMGRRIRYDYSQEFETDTVNIFLGIPYAEPPTGQYRFQSPRPIRAWAGRRDSTRQGSVCPQISYSHLTSADVQSEDCLNLNIYAPHTPVVRTNIQLVSSIMRKKRRPSSSTARQQRRKVSIGWKRSANNIDDYVNKEEVERDNNKDDVDAYMISSNANSMSKPASSVSDRINDYDKNFQNDETDDYNDDVAVDNNDDGTADDTAKDRDDNDDHFDVDYPVMVYIHGGSYEEGSGAVYDGSILALHRVVVVTINYRLGQLGYLTSGDARMRGNWGLEDQIEALRWVRDNIRVFGGDPGRVTLVGSSAGAASIGLLMTSPAAKDLFHSAILQSGSPLSFWSHYDPTLLYTDHETYFRHVAQRAGCPPSRPPSRPISSWPPSSASSSSHPPSVETLTACLRNVSYESFIEQHWQLDPLVPSYFNFRPRIDGSSLLPHPPEKAFLEGRYQPVPVLLGVVEDEWARSLPWFVVDIDDSLIDDTEFDDGLTRLTFEEAVRHVIIKRFRWPPEVAEAAILEYTQWRNMEDPYVNRLMFKEFMSDLTILSGTVRLSNYLSSSSCNPPIDNIPEHIHSIHRRKRSKAESSKKMKNASSRRCAHERRPPVYLYKYNYLPGQTSQKLKGNVASREALEIEVNPVEPGTKIENNRLISSRIIRTAEQPTSRPRIRHSGSRAKKHKDDHEFPEMETAVDAGYKAFKATKSNKTKRALDRVGDIIGYSKSYDELENDRRKENINFDRKEVTEKAIENQEKRRKKTEKQAAKESENDAKKWTGRASETVILDGMAKETGKRMAKWTERGQDKERDKEIEKEQETNNEHEQVMELEKELKTEREEDQVTHSGMEAGLDQAAGSWWGVYHTMELDMVFGSPFSGRRILDQQRVEPEVGSREGGRTEVGWNDEDRQMSRTMMMLWTNFIKYGNPTPDTSEENQEGIRDQKKKSHRQKKYRHHHQDKSKKSQSISADFDKKFLQNITNKDWNFSDRGLVSQQLIKWLPTRPIKTDYLYVSLNNITMLRHLRTRQMSFWNNLVPRLLSFSRSAQAADKASSRRDETSRLASVDRQSGSTRGGAEHALGVLAVGLTVICVVLMGISCGLACKYSRLKQRHERHVYIDKVTRML